MISSLKEILEYANKEGCAVGAFNTNSLESVMAVLEAAESLKLPVILNHAEIHEEIISLEVIGPVMLRMAEKAHVPVCVHLDHGATFEYLKRALELGFKSVMYDGSHLSYEDNVRNTKKVVALAKRYGADVEAEIGVLGGSEISGEAGEAADNNYTDPVLAQKFAKETGIDALAASFGTAHGFYKVKPKLDFERIERIRELTKLPLVMHGGSGVSPESYQEAIRRGVRKINYYSYMSCAGVLGVRTLLENNEIKYFHDVAKAATASMRENVMQAMKIFSMKTL